MQSVQGGSTQGNEPVLNRPTTDCAEQTAAPFFGAWGNQWKRGDQLQHRNHKSVARPCFWTRLSRQISGFFNPNSHAFKTSPLMYKKDNKQSVWPWLAGIGALIIGIGSGAALHKNWGRIFRKEAKAPASLSHSETEFKALENEKTTLQQQNAALVQEKDTAVQAKDAAEQAKKDLAAQKASAEDLAEKQRLEAQRLQEAKEGEARARLAAENEVAARGTELQELKRQLEIRNSQLNQTETALTEARELEIQLKTQAQEGQLSLAQQKSQLDDLHAILESEKGQQKAMKAEIEVARDTIAQLEKLHKETEEARNELQAQLDLNKDKIRELRSSLASGDPDVSKQMTQLQEEHDFLRQELQVKTSEAKDKQDEIDSLRKNQSALSKQLEEKNAALDHQNRAQKEFEQQATDTVLQLQELTESLGTINRSKLDLEKTKGELETQLAGEKEEVQRKIDENESLNRQLQESEQTSAQIQSQVAGLEAAKNEAKATSAELTRKFNDLNKEHEAALVNLAELETQNREIETLRQQLESANTLATEARRQSETSLEQKDKKIGDLQSSLEAQASIHAAQIRETLEQTRNAILQEQSKLQAELEEKNKTIGSLQDSLVGETSRHAEQETLLRDQLVDLQASLKAETSRSTEQQRAAESLMQSQSQLRELQLKAQQEKAAAQTEIDRLRTEKRDLEEQLDDLALQLGQQQEAFHELSQSAGRTQVSVDDFELQEQEELDRGLGSRSAASKVREASSGKDPFVTTQNSPSAIQVKTLPVKVASQSEFNAAFKAAIKNGDSQAFDGCILQLENYKFTLKSLEGEAFKNAYNTLYDAYKAGTEEVLVLLRDTQGEMNSGTSSIVEKLLKGINISYSSLNDQMDSFAFDNLKKKQTALGINLYEDSLLPSIHKDLLGIRKELFRINAKKRNIWDTIKLSQNSIHSITFQLTGNRMITSGASSKERVEQSINGLKTHVVNPNHFNIALAQFKHACETDLTMLDSVDRERFITENHYTEVLRSAVQKHVKGEVKEIDRSGNLAVLQILLKEGADIHARDEHGDSILQQVAAMRKPAPDVLETLLSGREDIEADLLKPYTYLQKAERIHQELDRTAPILHTGEYSHSHLIGHNLLQFAMNSIQHDHYAKEFRTTASTLVKIAENAGVQDFINMPGTNPLQIFDKQLAMIVKGYHSPDFNKVYAHLISGASNRNALPNSATRTLFDLWHKERQIAASKVNGDPNILGKRAIELVNNRTAFETLRGLGARVSPEETPYLLNTFAGSYYFTVDDLKYLMSLGFSVQHVAPDGKSALSAAIKSFTPGAGTKERGKIWEKIEFLRANGLKLNDADREMVRNVLETSRADISSDGLLRQFEALAQADIPVSTGKSPFAGSAGVAARKAQAVAPLPPEQQWMFFDTPQAKPVQDTKSSFGEFFVKGIVSMRGGRHASKAVRHDPPPLPPEASNSFQQLKMLVPGGKRMSDEQAAQWLVETNLTGLKKQAQIAASDKSVPAHIRAILEQTLSSNQASRNYEATVQYIKDQYQRDRDFSRQYHLRFPDNGTVLSASVGEVVFATLVDKVTGAETKVALKVRKDDINPVKVHFEHQEVRKQIEQDAAILLRDIDRHFSGPERDIQREAIIRQRDYELNRVDNLYKAWKKEYDFRLEAQNGELLQSKVEEYAGTRGHYRVAKAITVGDMSDWDIRRAGSTIAIEFLKDRYGRIPCSNYAMQEFAPGLPLEKIMSMIEYTKTHSKADYERRFAKEIAENWAYHPDEIKKWGGLLPHTYLDVANTASYLRVPQGEETLAVHGDPHPGNIFFEPVLEKGEYVLKPTYIDTGLVVRRNAEDYAAHLKLMRAMLTGNSQDIAEFFVKRASNTPESPEQFAVRNAKEQQEWKDREAAWNLREKHYKTSQPGLLEQYDINQAKQRYAQDLARATQRYNQHNVPGRIAALQADLDAWLYGQEAFEKAVNITKIEHNNKIIQYLTMKQGIHSNPDDEVFFKAKMQEALVFARLSEMVGQEEENNLLHATLPAINEGISKLQGTNKDFSRGGFAWSLLTNKKQAGHLAQFTNKK